METFTESAQLLNWRLRFKDPLLQQEFFQSMLGHKFHLLIVLISLVFLFLVFPHKIISLTILRTLEDFLIEIFVCIASISIPILGFAICYCQCIDEAVNNSSPYLNTRWIPFLQASFIISLTSFNLLFLVQLLFFEDCIYFPRDNCASVLENDAVLYSILAIVCFTPAILSTALHEIRVDYILGSLICFDIIFTVFSTTKHPQLFFSCMIAIWSVLAAVIIIDIHFARITKFLQQKRLKEALLEIERMQAEELRHMIGNVAHDLKTPLASFIAGMEIIDDATRDLEENIIKRSVENQIQKDTNSKQHADVTTLRNNLSTIKRSLENARLTNSFMLMTINRCIDYTKASRGMKLTPKYETVNVMETIMLPLRCMSNIQEKIRIVLEPLSADICSHIITDKQWLQENLLCLLSNAVKYSSSGDVTIMVTLVRDFDSTWRSNFKMKKLLKGIFNPANRSVSSSKLARFDISNSESAEPTLHITENNFPACDKDEDSSTSLRLASRVNDHMASNTEYNDSQTNFNFNSEEDSDVYLRFEIDDHGVGLSDEAMKGLFNPFKQAQRLAGGTGLGLYSLAKRMDAIKGQHGVTKRRDGEKGSIFWFSIPYKPDEVTSQMFNSNNSSALHQECLLNIAAAEESSKEITINSSSTSVHSFLTTLPTETAQSTASKESSKLSELKPTWNLLLVDDSPTIVKMMVLMMKRHGHCITTAENGEIALQLIEERWKRGEGEFDFVLMDLQMPVMDGLEATRRLRKIELEREKEKQSNVTISGGKGDVIGSPGIFCRKLIVIGMSANSDDETVEEAMRAGITTFIAKPFSLDVLKAAIAKLLH